ncbi:MAG: BrnT family toxin [Patescibacteria group bacterium]|nr:BrnT family toxin [Patescibacteria group bacterium]
MKYFDWDEVKNGKLKAERDISFEEAIIAIEAEGILDIVDHPNQKRYPGQKIFVVNINIYAYLIPFVEDTEKIFLKTIISSRRATKKYLIERRKV